MKRAALSFVLLGLFSIFGGCVIGGLPNGDGGKLIPTPKKSALDGFFLFGDLKYVEKHLKVRTWKDAASFTTRLYVEYKNTGRDGIWLYVTCNWTGMDGNTIFGDVWHEYSTVIYPYSRYVIRHTAWQNAQKHTSLSCDHSRTLEKLYNEKIQRSRASE